MNHHYRLRLAGNGLGAAFFALATIGAAISDNGLAVLMGIGALGISLVAAYEVNVHETHLGILRERLQLALKRGDQARAEIRQLRNHNV